MATGQGRTVSVVIRTYTQARWDYLLTAVESVWRQTMPPREIVLVIDHNPALRDRARAYLPGTRVVENDWPAGSSGTWNSGVAAARGEIVAFIDDDAIATPDWLERLAAEYDDPAVVGVGGLIEPVWLAGRPSWFPDEFGWAVCCSYRGLPETKGEVRNLIGCNMSFRRETLASIGWFRTQLGHVGGRPLGCDETELSIRVRQRWPDKRLLHLPTARVRHQLPAQRCTWRAFVVRCALEGRSKARMSRFVGAADGLSTERDYVLRTLPRGVLRGLIDAVARRDPSGLARAGTIVTGLAITTTGYVVGLLAPRPAPGGAATSDVVGARCDRSSP